MDAVFLDFRKAFDCVPHKRLLMKIEKLGKSGNLLKWIKDFLTSDFIWDFGKLPFPTHLGKYFIIIGKIRAKIHEIGKIKAIFGLGMTPIYGLKNGQKKSLLTDRQQRVLINGISSEWTEVSSGIPQGSVLGPLLFILYVNDLPSEVSSFCKLFADDAKLYKDLQNLEDFEMIQNDIVKLCQWTIKWLILTTKWKIKMVTARILLW